MLMNYFEHSNILFSQVLDLNGDGFVDIKEYIVVMALSQHYFSGRDIFFDQDKVEAKIKHLKGRTRSRLRSNKVCSEVEHKFIAYFDYFKKPFMKGKNCAVRKRG